MADYESIYSRDKSGYEWLEGLINNVLLASELINGYERKILVLGA